jgi:flagellar protein FliT
MAQAQVIEAYERLLEQSQRMQECAIRGDWGQILIMRSQGLIDEEALRHVESGIELDAVHQELKFALIKQILQLESEVRRRLAERQSQLGALILSSRLKRGQSKAYRAPPPPARPVLRAVSRTEL